MGTLTFNVSKGPHWTSAYLGATKLAQWNATLASALSYFASLFNPLTDKVVSIEVDADFVAGGALSIGTAAAMSIYTVGNATFVGINSYADLIAALRALPTDPIKASAYPTLPASDPIAPDNYSIFFPWAYMVGLWGSGVGAGSMGFASSADGSDPTGATGSSYILFWLIIHEISEIFGRVLFNNFVGNTAADLFRYSGAHVRNVNPTSFGYLSIDDGATNLGNYHTASDGLDFGDWDNAEGLISPFNAVAAVSVATPLRPQDIKQLGVIGLPMSDLALTLAGYSSRTGARFKLH